MPDPHLWQFVGPFAVIAWWTKSWLLDRVISRWRHLIASLFSIIGWIYLAFTATRVGVNSSGVQIVFGSVALAYLCAFMAIVSVAGLLIGLLFWSEEAVEDASSGVSEFARSNLGD